jgi:hypothetical protein
MDTEYELDWQEATELSSILLRSTDQAIAQWLKKKNLTGARRDTTGVRLDVIEQEFPDRPSSDEAFAASETRIAQGVWDAARLDRTPPSVDPSIFTYEGIMQYPSYCQIAHRQDADHVEFALIHSLYGGTSPTNIFENLATHLRQRFYPNVDAGLIDWYDVVPAGLNNYSSDPMRIDRVQMTSSNGVYSSPSWSRYQSPSGDDWAHFVLEVIDRVQLAQAIRCKARCGNTAA